MCIRDSINISGGYLSRADRQPQNEDNSVGLMVDAVAGKARTDLYQKRSSTDSVALNGYRSYPMGDIFAQERNENTNRFTQSLNARYYPFSWLTTRTNLGFDYSLICLLYTSDAADERSSVDLGGRRIIK